MLGTCLLSTPWCSVLVSFDVSESESGKELRLGGGSLERESFVCNMRTWFRSWESTLKMDVASCVCSYKPIAVGGRGRKITGA